MYHLREGNPPVSYFEENLCTHYNLIGSCTIDEHYHIVLPSSTIIATVRERLHGQRSSPKLLITLTPINSRMSHLVSLRSYITFIVLLYFSYGDICDILTDCNVCFRSYSVVQTPYIRQLSIFSFENFFRYLFCLKPPFPFFFKLCFHSSFLFFFFLKHFLLCFGTTQSFYTL